MISRLHGLVLSLLLGTAAAAGAYAVIGTGELGHAKTKPEVATGLQIAARARKLDAWEASLRQAARAEPPALPPLNQYAAVALVAAPGAAALPTVSVAPRRTARTAAETATPTRQTAKLARRLPKTRAHVLIERSRPAGASASTQTAARAADERAPAPRETTAEIAAKAPAPVAVAPAPAPAAVAQAPAPAPAAAPVQHTDTAPTAPPVQAQPPAALSAEQKCRLLLSAAQGQSEQVKQAAEAQCEALKNGAGGGD